MIIDIIQTHFNHFDLSSEELEVLQKVLKISALKRNEIFAEAGRHSNMIGVVIEGSMNSFFIDEGGCTVIQNVFYQGEQYFVFDYESYLEQVPLKTSISANEHSLLLTGNIQQVKKLYEKFPRLYQIEVSVMKQHFVKALNRIKILQEKDPVVKLKILQRQLPGIFMHFSYSQIASYLGVHRNTIGRALKKI